MDEVKVEQVDRDALDAIWIASLKLIGAQERDDEPFLQILARHRIAAIPQAGDTGEFVEWLEGEAETFDQIGLNVDKIMRQVGTDPVQSSGKLGDTLREAATTIRTLQARLDVETERCAKVAELYQRDVGDGDDTPLLEANRICQVIATAIRERNGSD